MYFSNESKTTRRTSVVKHLVRETTHLTRVPDLISERLTRAVVDNDVNVINELHRSGSESLEDTLMAIVKSDNDELLTSIVDTIEITDGAITTDNGNHINTPVLKYAIKRSALKCVRAFMRRGVSTDSVRLDLVSAAIEQGDIDMISNLLTQSTLEEDKQFAMLAARRGNAEALETILHDKSGAISAVEETGDGLLHLSARSQGEGSINCISLLLDSHGLDIEARNGAGRTPLHVAAADVRSENARHLISRGAQLNCHDSEGESVWSTIVKNVPRAMEEYEKYLDEGISLCDDKATMTLDYGKIFKRSKMGSLTTEMTLFKHLGDSPFKHLIEHPLCHSFLQNKFKKVIWFFVLILLVPHFLFSVAFSVYSGLMFGHLCVPEDSKKRWNFSDEIPCNNYKINETNKNETHETHERILVLAQGPLMFSVCAAWIILVISICIYLGREAVSLYILKHQYFCKWDGYRNLLIIISIVLVVHKGYPTKKGLSLQRWQYHVASIACLLLWLEMLVLVGKIPRFGKYIHMFRSVSMKIIEFFTSYIWLAIGFMMMFIILFSSKSALKINNFPGALVTILVMMLGEINYEDLYYPNDQTFHFKNFKNNGTGLGTVKEEPAYQNFPVTAQFTIILFTLVFCLVIMNLLVGIAVSDIRQLMKTAKRDHLLSQVELISSVESFRKTRLFHFLPDFVQSELRRLVDFCDVCGGNICSCEQIILGYYQGDIKDKHFPDSLKKTLFDFCLRKEKIKKKKLKEEELKAIKEQNVELKAELLEVKQLLLAMRPPLESSTKSH